MSQITYTSDYIFENSDEIIAKYYGDELPPGAYIGSVHGEPRGFVCIIRDANGNMIDEFGITCEKG